MRNLTQLGTGLLVVLAACGTSATAVDAGDPDAWTDTSPDATLDATLDAIPDATGTDAGPDAELDARADVGPDPIPWEVTPTLVGVGHAVTEGVALPVFPFSVLAAGDRVFVVGEARSEFRWGDTLYPSGGYLLAIDAVTGSLLFHRSFGRGSSVNDIALLDSDVVVVGSFVHPTIFAPSTSSSTELTSVGAGDLFVTRMTIDGDFVWARSVGSAGYDGAFSVDVGDRGILVSGYLRGDWSGCGGTLRSFPGIVDPIEGRLLGTQDALIVQMDGSGTCIDASVIGHPGTDEFALHVAATEAEIFLSGEGQGPLVRRDVSGDEQMLGGREGGWLVRLGDDDTHDVWSVGTRGARGRGLGVQDEQLYFSFRASGGDLWHNDDVIRGVERGVSLMRLSLTDHSISLWWLGRGTADTVDLAISSAGVVVPATGSDPSHIRVGLLEGDTLRSFRNSSIATFPYVVSAAGRTVWMAGTGAGRTTALGVDLEIPFEAQGGLFLVRFDL